MTHSQPQPTSLYCAMQNRLGALDRLLAALTHRGLVPRQMFSSCNEETGTLEVSITFSLNDEKTLEKLIKSLQKQIYVLDVRVIGRENASQPQQRPVNVTPLFTQQAETRRTAHAHNA